MPRGNLNDVMEASKIFSFSKGSMLYNWLIFADGKSLLVGNKPIDDKFLKLSEDLLKDTEIYTLIKKVVGLLKDGYSISIYKNRSGIVLKGEILKKYIFLLKKYYGKNETIDLALDNFLRHYSLDNIAVIPDVMTDINHKIIQLNNKIA